MNYIVWVTLYRSALNIHLRTLLLIQPKLNFHQWMEYFKPIKSNQIKITSKDENKSNSFKDLKLSYGSKIETNSFDVDVIENQN